MATHPAPVAADARATAHRLRLSPAVVYACRCCRAAVRVNSARHLPERCPTCGAATWTLSGRCNGMSRCHARRPPGLRGRAHCHSCGYSIWALVPTRGRG
jgi:hypothetical protein